MMRAGAVLSLLLCLVAFSQGAQLLLNPDLDGCELGEFTTPTSWSGSGGSISHAAFGSAFTNIPAGDTCTVNLFSNPAQAPISQSINVPTTGSYDFSALVSCFQKASDGISCGYLLTIDGVNFPLTGATNVPAEKPSTYLPVTALGISLTAGTYTLIFKATFSKDFALDAFLTYASLVPSAAASGDPHMVGFQGQRFDYIGEPGQIINLLTDPELQVNTLLDLMKNGENSFIPGPVMMEMAFMTRGHTVMINAGGYQKDEIGFVTVDGVLLPLGHSFLDGILSVVFTALNANSKDLGLTGNDHIVAQVDVNLEGLFEFRVFMIENGRDKHNPDHWMTKYPRRFLDFNASLLDQDRRPHGVLGQTAAPLSKERSVGEWTIEGKDQDYVVKDGITGTQFTFNQF